MFVKPRLVLMSLLLSQAPWGIQASWGSKTDWGPSVSKCVRVLKGTNSKISAEVSPKEGALESTHENLVNELASLLLFEEAKSSPPLESDIQTKVPTQPLPNSLPNAQPNTPPNKLSRSWSEPIFQHLLQMKLLELRQKLRPDEVAQLLIESHQRSVLVLKDRLKQSGNKKDLDPSGGEDKTLVKVFKPWLFREIPLLTYSAEFSPDGRWLLANHASIATLWDPNTAVEQAFFESPRGGLSVKSSLLSFATFSHDGSKILIATRNHQLSLWDASKAKLLWSDAGRSGFLQELSAAVFSPDDQHILTSTFYSGNSKDERNNPATLAKMSLLDTATGQLTHSFGDLCHHQASALHGRYSPRGDLIVSVSKNKQMEFRDGKSTKLLWSWDAHIADNGHLASIAWAPDGLSIVASYSNHKRVVWDAKTGRQRLVLVGDGDSKDRSGLGLAEYSPDGRYIATAAWNENLVFWNAHTGERLATVVLGVFARSLAFSRDSRSIALATGAGIRLYALYATVGENLEIKGRGE